MNLQIKKFGIIALIFIFTSVILYVATVTIVQSQYIKLESNDVKQDTGRAVDALNNRVAQLAQKIPDWSTWDDTYKFVIDHNKQYIESNTTNATLQNLSVNFMLWYNVKQQLVYYKAVDVDTGKSIDLPPELIKALAPGSELLAKDNGDESQGLLKTSTYPLIVATRPILNSEGDLPHRGTFVFAKYLSIADKAHVAELTHLKVAFLPAIYANGSLTAEASDTSTTNATTNTQGPNKIFGRQLVNDIYGRPILVVHVEEPRSIYSESQKTLLYYFIIVTIAMLAAILAVLFASNRVSDQAHNRLKAAIDSLEVGLLMTFKDGHPLSFNKALPKILGCENAFKDKNISKTGLDVLEGRLLTSKFDLIEDINKCQSTGKPIRASEVAYGNSILSITGNPVIDKKGKIIGTAFLFSDVTEAKILERSKDEFFSIASHELRTPLTSIRGNSTMILDQYHTLLKDKQLRGMVRDMHESSVRLIEIVNDFLDVSRLEQGKMRFSYGEVAVEKVIENVAYEMKQVLREKALYLKIDKLTLNRLPKVWADEDRLKQVIYNLIGNAAKYTEQGGITVSTHAGSNSVKVLISDTGGGMTPEEQRLLFHKFQQASSSLLTRDTSRGTGLGLYISKMIMDNMGGKISLEKSVENSGSVFSITLPTVDRRGATQSAPTTETDTTTGLSKELPKS